MIDEYGWLGKWSIKVINKIDNTTTETTIKNRVMNAALDELVKVLQGQTPDMQIKYLALGSSNTAVTDSQTKLGNETFRTQITTLSKTGTGEITSLAIVLDVEANGTINEIGIFGGSGATSTKDSGIMISRILWNKVKSSNEEIQFTRVDKIQRA